MNHRADYKAASAASLKAMLGMETCVRHSGLEHSLLERVKMGVSQITGCACCLDRHSKRALPVRPSSVCMCWQRGARHRSIHRVNGPRRPGPWRSPWWPRTCFPMFCMKKRRAQFDEKAMVGLTLVIVTLNSRNHLAIGFGAEVGDYQAPAAA
jgi:AhpD family alkylhydroperoxidase